MKLAHILCPIDLSDNHALDYASQLAHKTGAVLHILYVEEAPTPYGIGLYGQLPIPLQRDLQTVNRTTPTVEGVPFERHIAFGPAAEKVLSFALDHGVDVDVIVMGTHGRTGATRLLLGSVAEKVLRQASCPVITIRRKRGDRPQSSPSGSPVVAKNK